MTRRRQLRRAALRIALGTVLLGAVLALALAAGGRDREAGPSQATSHKGDPSASPPARAPATDPALAAELHRLGAEGGREDHSDPAAPPAALAAARRFLRPYLAYEAGAHRNETRSRLHRTSTARFAAQLLAAPPRVPPGLDHRPPRAILLALEATPTTSGGSVTVVARLRRGHALEAAAFELVHRQRGWLVAGTAG